MKARGCGLHGRSARSARGRPGDATTAYGLNQSPTEIAMRCGDYSGRRLSRGIDTAPTHIIATWATSRSRWPTSSSLVRKISPPSTCTRLFARGTARADSDLDIGILLKIIPQATLESQPYEREAELERTLARPVQIVILNRAPSVAGPCAARGAPHRGSRSSRPHPF